MQSFVCYTSVVLSVHVAWIYIMLPFVQSTIYCTKHVSTHTYDHSTHMCSTVTVRLCCQFVKQWKTVMRIYLQIQMCNITFCTLPYLMSHGCTFYHSQNIIVAALFDENKSHKII